MSKNKLNKSDKAGFQISFAWLFAIIVGAFILFLAIYGVTRIVDTGEDVASARAGVEIGVLLNPLETGFESGHVTLLTMPVDTRIHNRCDDFTGNFGKQIIQVSQKSRGRWSQTDIDARFENKYIFSNTTVEGRNFFLFSKPFNFPFKIADLLYITSAQDKYCFVEAPQEIKNELNNLSQENLYTEDYATNCPVGSINVCFKRIDCDLNVDYDGREVEKKGQKMYFDTDALMYAAIFSDKNTYECQVQRLMKRAYELSVIYEEKADILSRENCAPDIDIFLFGNEVKNVQSSRDLTTAAETAKHIDSQNTRARCRLW